MSGSRLHAQDKGLSADSLLRVVLETVQSQSVKDTRAFSPKPIPIFRHGRVVYVDRDGLDAQLLPLGFKRDYPAGPIVVSGVVLSVRSWESVRSCLDPAVSKTARCAIPASAMAIRFTEVAWTVPNSELTILVGAYTGLQRATSASGFAGNVTEYVFGLKNGTWSLVRVGRIIVS